MSHLNLLYNFQIKKEKKNEYLQTIYRNSSWNNEKKKKKKKNECQIVD